MKVNRSLLALGLIAYAGLLNSIDYFSMGLSWSVRGFYQFPLISPNPFIYICTILAVVIFIYDRIDKRK